MDSVTRETQGAAASPYASLGDRLIAQLVDGLVALGVFFVVGMTLAPRFGGVTETGFSLSGWPALLVMGICMVLLLAYFILAEALLGATLGKLAAGIRVETPAGGRISLRASVIRNVVRIVDGIGVYLVAVITVLVTKRNQRLGDLAADTVVVRRASSRAVRAGGLVAAILLAIGGVVAGFLLREEAPRPTTVTRPTRPATPVRGALTATLARDVSAEYQPIEPTTTFAPDTAVIHVAFKVSAARAGTRLKSVWRAVDVGGAVPANSQLAESTLTLPGPAPGSFRLRRGSDPWPVGDYKVELYLDDRLVLTLPFKVAP